MLDVAHLNKTYGDLKVLNDISLHVDRGVGYILEYAVVREEVELLEYEPAVLAELLQLMRTDVDRVAVLIRMSGLLSHIYDLSSVDGLEEGRAPQQRRFA